MDIIGWFLDRTPHQLDVIRTVSVALGGGCVPVLGFVLTWLLRGIRIQTRQTVKQTRREDFVDGELRSVSVAELAHQAAHDAHRNVTNTQDLRTDLLIEDMMERPHARRRLMTEDIPLQETP